MSRKSRFGFSLVELLVVAAVLTIFAAILFVVASAVWKVVQSWQAVGDAPGPTRDTRRVVLSPPEFAAPFTTYTRVARPRAR